MRRFLPIIVFFFFIFLFYAKSQAFALAQISATPWYMLPTTDEAGTYIFGNLTKQNPRVVTEQTKTVHITFDGLPGGNYDICLSTNCLLFSNKSKDLSSLISSDQFFKDIKIEKNKSIANGIYVCADGEDSLKLASDANGTECAGDDYFHGGHIYGVVLGNQDGIADNAVFYVSRYYPQVFLVPGTIKPGDKINVQIIGARRPHRPDGAGDYDADNNNYAVEIASADDPESIFDQKCVDVPDDDAGTTVTFNARMEGDYIIKINEQTHEGNLLHDGCSAEFTYYWLKFRVRSQKFWTDQCSKNNTSPICKSLIELIPDPNGTDVPGGRKGPKAPLPPCAIGNWDPLTSDTCPKLHTAVGDINTTPQGFIGSVLGLVLGLSGGIALLLIIYSGYQMISSQGNPEKLEAARQQLVSAIVGLLFIIFSLVILQFIGFNILKIPGIGP